MAALLIAHKSRGDIALNALLPRTASRVAAILRQDRTMGPTKRERWTEDEVLALPPGENDAFERKAGALLGDRDWREKLAKALSALANSGGGSLIIGIHDDGATFDGVDPMVGKTSRSEWFEQTVPHLLSYPLDDFRIHVVEPASATAIPAGKQVIVIDVGDSRLAPHQSVEDRRYYQRVGGHSVRAPHFYLETLRSRLVGPALSIKLAEVELAEKGLYGNGDLDMKLKLVFRARFSVKNEGRVAAYKWRVISEHPSRCPHPRTNDRCPFCTLSRPPGGLSGIPLDDTLLPSLGEDRFTHFETVLRSKWGDRVAVRAELDEFAKSGWAIGFRVVSETSPGELKEEEILKRMDLDWLAARIVA